MNEVKNIGKNTMDKKIRAIEKDVKHHKDEKAEKELKSLEKMDKKRDRFVEAGKKAMKGKH